MTECPSCGVVLSTPMALRKHQASCAPHTPPEAAEVPFSDKAAPHTPPEAAEVPFSDKAAPTAECPNTAVHMHQRPVESESRSLTGCGAATNDIGARIDCSVQHPGCRRAVDCGYRAGCASRCAPGGSDAAGAGSATATSIASQSASRTRRDYPPCTPPAQRGL